MPFMTVDSESNTDIKLHYQVYGISGPNVLLIHGWPLNGDSWEKQIRALLKEGYRVITYDRRGFGLSSHPGSGYDYDTFADDLNQLMSHLNLSDVTLVGFSMGSGEVTRYISKYGSKRVAKAVLIGVIPPFLLKTENNPAGVDEKVFESIKAELLKDRPAYLMEFLKQFFNYDVYEGKRISEMALQANWIVGIGASPLGTEQCVDAWLTDFRQDVARIDVPCLIVHGDQDRILPIEVTADLLSKLIKDAKYVRIEGAPHGLLWTHAEEVNQALLGFLGPAENLARATPTRTAEARPDRH